MIRSGTWALATSKPGILAGVRPHGHGACAGGSDVGGLKISDKAGDYSVESAVMMLVADC